MNGSSDLFFPPAYEKSEHEKELLRLLTKGDREIETGERYSPHFPIDSQEKPWPLQQGFQGIIQAFKIKCNGEIFIAFVHILTYFKYKRTQSMR